MRALVLAERVRVVLHEREQLVEEKDAETFFGSPEIENDAEALAPVSSVAVTVSLPEAPRGTLTLGKEADTENVVALTTAPVVKVKSPDNMRFPRES